MVSSGIFRLNNIAYKPDDLLDLQPVNKANTDERAAIIGNSNKSGAHVTHCVEDRESPSAVLNTAAVA